MLSAMQPGSSAPENVIHSERLDLVLLSAPVLHAIIAGDRDRASALVDFVVPASFPEEHDLEFLRFRCAQLDERPSWAIWLARAVVRRDDRLLVGTATFHGPPGINDLAAPDAVEVGYTIAVNERNRGYATETARAMMAWALERHGIRLFVSGIEPDNGPSLRVIHKLGFHPTGIVDDGELIFDLHL
jgi:[ribosomal protein S5]-alanine N-acetyltransferase